MPARLSTELTSLRTDVCRAASQFDPRGLDRDATVAALREWTAIVHASEAALAMAAARVAQCGPPPSAGASSAADFVAKETGTTSARASQTIKTGEGLRDNERTRLQATTGRLSSAQTAAITDALSVSPDREEHLLATAERSSLGGLRDQCANAKAANQDLTAIEKRIHATRSLRRYVDADGAAHLHAVGTKASMSRLDAALAPLIDKRFEAARADDGREPFEAYAYDALLSLVDGTSVAEPSGKERMRYLGVLRIDFEALIRGHVTADETCEIAGLGPISVETARELLGESILKLVITKGVDVLNVTHLGRGPNTAQKIALLWQQPICVRERCGRRARLEHDHGYGVEWAKTKHTRVDETERLCHADHFLKTVHGWALVEGTGTRPMVPPDDPRHPKNRPPP
jgi:hypothetical protein